MSSSLYNIMCSEVMKTWLLVCACVIHVYKKILWHNFSTTFNQLSRVSCVLHVCEYAYISLLLYIDVNHTVQQNEQCHVQQQQPAYSGENLDILTFYQVVGKSLWNVHIWDMIKVQYSLQVHKNIWIYILRLYKLVIFETYILLVKKKHGGH